MKIKTQKTKQPSFCASLFLRIFSVSGTMKQRERILFMNAIERIQKMEQYLEEIQNAMQHSPSLIFQDNDLSKKLEQLESYYTDGQWMEDYERDERRELPKDLKRGVLAQDTLWNLFCEIEEVKKGSSSCN